MTIGLIYCAWQAADLVPLSLTPWLEAKRTRLGGHEFVICAVSVPFESFPQTEQLDDTLHLLRLQHAPREIDHLISGDKPMKETEARGAALQWLANQGVDLIWQWDSDEITTADEIQRTLAFVEARPQVAWFRGSLRNYVFDQQTYLTEPFTPARIHRVQVGGYRATSFYDDNNVNYHGTITRDIKKDLSFPSVTIPKAVAWVRHLTWLSDFRSRAKVRYQESRGWKCSFKWDETKGLVWNEALPIPETARDYTNPDSGSGKAG